MPSLSSPFPHAHYLSLSLSSLALLFPVSTPRTVAYGGGSGCCGGGDGGGRLQPRLPLVVVVAQLGCARCSVVIPLPVVVVVGVPVSSPGLAAPRLHPASSCSERRLAVVVMSFHPRSTPRTVALGSLFSPFVLVVLPIPAPRAAARGSGWGCRRGISASLLFVVPLSTLRAGARSGDVGVGESRLVFRQLGEVLTSWLSHFPGLPDTSYAVSHPIYMGRRGWGWDSPCCQKVVVT